ncbi:TetR/AcrR family transcriptional regulator [Marinobacterium sp. MBR-111]|jgi:AcrR family transcriptional regulator|uniref:TetR/AcrR family transcriptional regulator n=1 Tax=Marinobacterium sp. MBR-111 TaxID=3156463 RepID=UPI0033971D3D
MPETIECPKRVYQSTEQRQSATIEAVVQLSADQNPSTLTTASIAERIGLSQGALFKHFPTKGRLWESVARWVSDQLSQRVFSVTEQYEQADKALEAMFMAHVSFIVQNPGVPRLMLGELQKPGNGPAKQIVRNTLANYRHRVVTLLKRGAEQGCLGRDIDTEAAAVLYLGAIQGLVVQGMVSGELHAIEHMAPRIYRLFSDSLLETTHDKEK